MSRACRLRGNNGKDQRDRIVAVSPFRNLRQPAATANPLTVSDLSVVNTHGYESTGSEGQAIDWNKPAPPPVVALNSTIFTSRRRNLPLGASVKGRICRPYKSIPRSLVLVRRGKLPGVDRLTKSEVDSGGGRVFSHNIGSAEDRYQRLPESQHFNVRQPRRTLSEEQALELVNEFFFSDGAQVDQLRIFLLIGIGGCGKTQLAREFMAQVYRKTHFFIPDASTEVTIKDKLASIARANGIEDTSDAALRWMSALQKDFFLYIDNADHHTMKLRKFFPNSSHARIFITTRLREAQQHYGSGLDSVISLGALSEDEALKLPQNANVLTESSHGQRRNCQRHNHPSTRRWAPYRGDPSPQSIKRICASVMPLRI
ncbi:hypothetical protein BDV98DRAFT_653767 [Pterulicium gracile]|uniref:P-loop containing nucleoside triphosphate hydrolase protein n=1 Tax=Pterulicium gracile TaxID=1884261 RepID=A0A5C3QT11_9AGAR|nr:hypothetical protein BDV98DRAFT_653767 [Pterula gracilis]